MDLLSCSSLLPLWRNEESSSTNHMYLKRSNLILVFIFEQQVESRTYLNSGIQDLRFHRLVSLSLGLNKFR